MSAERDEGVKMAVLERVVALRTSFPLGTPDGALVHDVTQELLQVLDEALEGADVSGEDERPHVYVHTDYSADDVRTFYEIPGVLAERVQPADERRTFAECLAALLPEETT